jgi:hypothetical protein
MDHLPCVRDPLHPPIDVPYVVLKENVYDGLGLLDFPQRLNLGLDMLDNQPQELGVVTSWLQSFCFFAFVIEVLKVPGVIVAAEDFICATESGQRFITTSRLINCLWLWPMRVRNQVRHIKERHGNEIVLLLVVVYKFVMENFRQLSKLNSLETLRVDLFQDPIYRIMLSIVILGKTLTQFFTAHYGIQFPTMLVPQRSNVAGWLVSIRDHSPINSHSGCGASRALVENPLLELVSPPLDRGRTLLQGDVILRKHLFQQ